jgi:photosystem II stability/assembly factor-like uncharacterized protein
LKSVLPKIVPAAVLCLTVLAASAATAPAPAADAPSWSRSELWGGDVRSLAFDPGDPSRVFAGTSGGHVYVSHDTGETWADAGRELALPGWVVSDLVFDPDVAGRLWAALWGTWGGGMVVVSDDGGVTWQPRGHADLAHTQVYTLARVPGRPEQVFAGTLSGVWGSTDGGESWRRLTADLPEVHKVTSLLVGPGDPDRVTAGTWQRAYRSDDGGVTWDGIFDGMVLDSEVFTLTPVPGRPNELWASTCGWVYRSDNAGGRWQRFTEGFENRRTPAFAALPGGRLLAGTVAGLHASDDGGRTWRRVGPASLSLFDLAYHPRNPQRVLLATEGSGVWVSDDGGTTLRRAARGMRNLRVAALVRAGREVLAAVNHAGPASGIHTSRDGGRTFEPESSEIPPVRDLVVYGVSVYAATERGLYERAGGNWRLIGEIGPHRVEQVVAAGNRLVVRTPQGLWEHDGPRFRRLEYHHGTPRSAALSGDGAALWVSDRAGLYRLTAGANDGVEVPFARGRVARFGPRLAWWGDSGLWLKPAEEDPWVRITGDAVRLLPTGDDDRPALVAKADGLALLDADSGELLPVDFPLPAAEVLSAMLHRPAPGAAPRLLLGTAGHGLYWAPLPED